MKIANFREYTNALRELYTGETMSEIGAYYRDLISSGQKINYEKSRLQTEINILNKKIKYQAQVVRESDDKKQAGIEVGKLKQAKQDLVMALKNLQNTNHFNVLTDEAKVCVCSGFLFQKFLTREILENNPLHFKSDAHGDLLVNTGELCRSPLFENARHVVDFVAAYIARYPQKVKTPGYFKTLLNQAKNWQELLEFVDENFDKINDQTELLPDNVKASRVGTHVVQEFPQQKALLVKLLNATALDYETSKMKHCVGKGAYDKKVASGESEIYSLRHVAEDGEWIPVGTIEISKGDIKQVKGIGNGNIVSEFVPLMRECIFDFAHNRDVAEIYRQQKLFDLTRCGYIFAADDTLIDLYNPPEEVHLKSLEIDDDNFKFISPEKIVLDQLNVKGKITSDVIDFMSHLKQVKTLELTRLEKQTWEDVIEVRSLLFEKFGQDNLDDFAANLGRNLQQYIGLRKDVDGKFFDLLDLKNEVEILYFDQNDFFADKIPTHFLTVRRLILTKPWNEESKQFVKRFKAVKMLDIRKGFVCQDVMKIREDLESFLGEKDLSGRVDCDSREKLGIFQRWEPQKSKELALTFELLDENKYQLEFVDTFRLENDDKIVHADTRDQAFPFMKHQHLWVNRVRINNQLSTDDLKRVSLFKGVQGVQIEDADLGALKELDMSQIKLCGLEPEVDSKDAAPWFFNFHFVECFSVLLSVQDHAVLIRNTKNLPNLENIKFPPLMKHLLFEPEEHRKEKLSDFAQYPNLQSLQLNKLDLSENEGISLPKGIKYLALYDCQLPATKEWDLREYSNLEVLRLNECDLSNIENIQLPKSMKFLCSEKAKLNPHCRLPQISQKNVFFGLGTCRVVNAR